MERISILGAGFNGLGAAPGSRSTFGGACVSESITVDGINYDFPLDAATQ